MSIRTISVVWLAYSIYISIVIQIIFKLTFTMTSSMMNTTKNNSTLSESMHRMITPQYEQIVHEIENIYHHPDTGCLS